MTSFYHVIFVSWPELVTYALSSILTFKKKIIYILSGTTTKQVAAYIANISFENLHNEQLSFERKLLMFIRNSLLPIFA